MLEKINAAHEANLKLAGENEAKQQKYLDALNASNTLLTDEQVTGIGGSSTPANKDEK